MRSNIPSTVFKPNELRIADIEALITRFDRSTTLGQILSVIKTKYPHKCPKCDGKGYDVKTFNTYPSGLPDSGWVDQMEDFKIICNICDGQGFTKERLIAKPITINVEYVKA